MQINTKFGVEDKVNIDGCENLYVYITAITWRSQDKITYECSWIANGDPKIALIEEWRLNLFQ